VSGVDTGRYLAALERARPVRARGRVTGLTGLAVRAAVPGACRGELVEIRAPGRASLPAEVVGFREEEAVLLPLGETDGVGLDSEVVPSGGPLGLGVGPGLVGRVLDGLGRPLDGAPLSGELRPWPVDRPAPNPLHRRRIAEPLALGVRAIDGLATVGVGQRIGIFAGAGAGKSTLLGQIARSTQAEVCVIGLVGERGREVRDFIEGSLGADGLKRSVVVAATSDAPAIVRLRAAQVAASVAEYFADEEGRRVLFMLDSLTRFARAQREVGLAAGELPARQGYPPSVFGALPRLLERAGDRGRGAITAVYTVLVAGGDMDEPIADEVRGLLDGHVVLSRQLAERGHWPAVDVLQSLSRLMPAVTSAPHRAAAGHLRALLAAHEAQHDLISVGAYRRGSDPRTDEAIERIGEIEAFLKQGAEEPARLEETVARLEALFG
jgi:type III secretion protein N (ATPase)